MLERLPEWKRELPEIAGQEDQNGEEGVPEGEETSWDAAKSLPGKLRKLLCGEVSK